MRPRHKAAENDVLIAHGVPEHDRASMRPRHKAAENRNALGQDLSVDPGFNEAAA